MLEKEIVVTFDSKDFQAVGLSQGDSVAEKLNIRNSPILFGCRMGICGSCAIQIESDDPLAYVKTSEEIEFFSAIGRAEENLRLACQISASFDFKIVRTIQL